MAQGQRSKQRSYRVNESPRVWQLNICCCCHLWTTQGLRVGSKDYGADIVKFVERHFYVDDGLISVSSPAEAIDFLQRAQAPLAGPNLHLHKFVSNSQAVLQAFCPKDCAPVIKNLFRFKW